MLLAIATRMPHTLCHTNRHEQQSSSSGRGCHKLVCPGPGASINSVPTYYRPSKRSIKARRFRRKSGICFLIFFMNEPIAGTASFVTTELVSL